MREILHPEQQPTFMELREQFREENLQRVRARIRQYLLIRKMSKDISTFIPTRFSSDYDTLPVLSQQQIEAMALAIGNPQRIPVKQTFGLEKVPLMLKDHLIKKAEESLVFDKVEIPGGTEHDGPPLNSLDENSVLAYMENLSKRSED